MGDGVYGVQGLDAELDAYLDGYGAAELDVVVDAHRAGGLMEDEIRDWLVYGQQVVDRVEAFEAGDVTRYRERFENEVNRYLDWMLELGCDDVCGVAEHLPELAARYDGFDPRPVVEAVGHWNNPHVMEYVFRSAPIWSEAYPEAMVDLLDTSWTAGRGFADVFSQYLPVIQDQVPARSEVLTEYVYPRLSITSNGTWDADAVRAAATTPLDELPAPLQDAVSETVRDEAVELDGIRPRLRNIKWAGVCDQLETRHWKTFLADDPSQETLLIAMDGMLVGSWKRAGDPSLLGLRDIEVDGRYPLQKGYVYEGAYPVWNRRNEAVDVDGWSVLEVDELPVNPLRRFGQKSPDPSTKFEAARERIDERVTEIEDLL